MTARNATRLLLAISFALVAVCLGIVAWAFIVLGYAATTMGAERAALFLFACALVPIVGVSLGGSCLRTWWRQGRAL
jgi:hypothetical protein